MRNLLGIHLLASSKVLIRSSHHHLVSSLLPKRSYNLQMKPIQISTLECIKPNNIRKYSDNVELASVDFNYVKKATEVNNILIVDVREPEEVQELGKIPNSINIPLGNVTQVFSGLSDKEFENLFNRPKPKKDSEIIFYCMIGKRSGKAQKDALKLGFKGAKNYYGSWTDWAANIK